MMSTKRTGKFVRAAGAYSDEISRHLHCVIEKSTKKNLRRHMSCPRLEMGTTLIESKPTPLEHTCHMIEVITH